MCISYTYLIFFSKALIDICNKDMKRKRYQTTMDQSEAKLNMKNYPIESDLPPSKNNKSKPFDEMNDVIANAILNLTWYGLF